MEIAVSKTATASAAVLQEQIVLRSLVYFEVAERVLDIRTESDRLYPEPKQDSS